MIKRKKAAVLLVLLVAGLAGYGVSAIRMQAFRDTLDPTQVVSALEVKPEVLEIMSGEFRSLLADYLLLKASVYLGGRFATPESCKQAVSILFRQSAALDPYFFQTCYFAQAHLPWWRGKYLETCLELLEIFTEHRSWHWEPAFYLGFDHFYFLKDNLTASRYLMEASERPDAPPLVGSLAAKLGQKSGQTEWAIAFLKNLYDRADQDQIKAMFKQRIDALEGVLVLERAVSRYASEYGHGPERLDQLVETGILKTLPANPFMKGNRYLYKDGKIEY